MRLRLTQFYIMFLTVSANIRIYEDTSRTIIVSGGLEVMTL